MTTATSNYRWAIGLSVAMCVAALPVPWVGMWRDAQAQSPSAQTAAPASPASQTRRAFETKDWYKVKTVGSPSMSPDGKYVAFQVTTVLEAKNTRMNEIWVVSTTANGGEPVRFSAPGFDSTNPRFSPDGTQVVFTSTRPGYSNTQWAVRIDRPGGEAPYTAATTDGAAAADTGGGEFGGRQGGPAAPATSQPKDKSFTVSTGIEGVPPAGRGEGRGGRGAQEGRRGGGGANDPYAAMPAMAKPPVNAITLPLDPTRFDGMQITDQRYKANGRGFVPSTGVPAGRGAGGRGGRGGGGDLIPADGQPPAQILIDRHDGAGRKALTSTAYSHRNAVVSPDGKWVVFAANSELRTDNDLRAVRDDINKKLGTEAARADAMRTRVQSDLFLMPVAGGTPQRLKVAGNESSIEWSPDSKYFTFTAGAGQGTNSHIYVADVNTLGTRSLTSDLRMDPGSVTWQGADALMQLTIGGRNALFRVNPKTGERKEIVGGRRRITGFSYDTARTKVAYVATSVDTPTELYLTDLSGSTPERKLTNVNGDLNKEIAWAPAERFTYKSVGDIDIEAWLVKPYGYEAGHKYPLVLYIHGGPHSAYTEGWFDEFQNLAGAGMWVLYTNPRGSSGYGGEFSNMIRNRWGDEDYLDLMKAVDIAAARPDVDPARLGVTGGSYGGFMTAWITTKTDRFKAAQTDRMIVNWVSWYGTSDAQTLTEGEFLGTPWQTWDSYINMSPIKYANKVKTPTLIVQSEEDHRTPIADAEQWFMALQKHNVPVEFLRYPRSNHDLSRTGEPWLLTDRLFRIRQWFLYWLKDEKPARTLTAPTIGQA
jgi:dipeptidyl aminopeptidase/acylaminoacyl peptidase